MAQKNIPAISVIIPMYNAEKYVGECLDSLLAQTFSDFEVIVVDDCSKDNSAAVVENYVPKFTMGAAERLRLVRSKVNSGGAGTPRNIGLRVSRGDYILFMDSDDMIIPGALEDWYKLIQESAADVIYCEKYYSIDAETNSAASTDNLSTSYGCQRGGFVDKVTVEDEIFANRVQRLCNEHYEMFPWDKFIKREILVNNGIEFPHLKVYDDFVWTFQILCYAKKIVRTPKPYYLYRNVPDSISRKKDTAEKNINFWMSPVISGLKLLDDFMGGVEFFQQNLNYRYAILDFFAKLHFRRLLWSFRQVPAYAFFEILRHGEGKNLKEHNVLVSYLMSAVDVYQHNFLAATRRIAELEKQIQAQKSGEFKIDTEDIFKR